MILESLAPDYTLLRAAADSRRLESAFAQEPFPLKTGRIILLSSVPVYHLISSPRELQFIPASTYRRTADGAEMIFNLCGSNSERLSGIADSKRQELAPPDGSHTLENDVCATQLEESRP